jgi:hypothetical protein
VLLIAVLRAAGIAGSFVVVVGLGLFCATARLARAKLEISWQVVGSFAI